MDSYKITGGHKLSGEVQINGAKNVALKALIASLLTEDEVIIKNIPRISDLFSLIAIVNKFGASVELSHDHEIRVSSKNLNFGETYSHEFLRLRVSFMLMVPLLLRLGEFKIPSSGGDKIGVRPIDRTLEGLKQMGAEIKYEDGFYFGKASRLKGTDYTFTKNTHTGTETLILAAVLAEGKTVLNNAAEEPEIDDLIKMLNDMGARIKRIKGRTIVIAGVKKLHGTEFTVIPDRNEAVTFAILSILTHSKIDIYPVVHSHLKTFYEALTQIGVGFQTQEHVLKIDGTKRPLSTFDFETAPYPGFMTDWQASWVLLMTQAEGVSHLWEKVFDNRFGYVSELNKMGADIRQYNPEVKNPDKEYNFNLNDGKNSFHAVEISGPTKLKGTDLFVSDLRAGATLVLAALTGAGESNVIGIEHIDRGYEDFDGRLKKLNARIERIKEV